MCRSISGISISALMQYGTSGWITETELLNPQKSGQFPDDPAKKKRLTNSQCSRPDVLTIEVMKEIVLEGRLL